MSKKSCFAVSAVFLLFLAFFFIMNLVTPDIEFSERENRYLQTLPKFTFSSLFSGEYISDFETYSTDQFPYRDTWITMKAALELASGKRENNGVILCESETLIEPFEAPDASVIEQNISSVNTLAEKADIPVYFALIPGKSDIWSNLLPANTPNDSQRSLIESAYSQTEAQTVDMYAVLSAHSDEYIYYRTDHHWTTLGAYYGYTALYEAMGLEYRPLSYFTPETVSEEFYGTTYSSSGFSWVKPDSMDLYVEDPGTLTIQNYLDGTAADGVLYDMSYLEKKDKYSVFFGGNTPLLQIHTGVEDGERILILRDSYADSLIPFLLSDFSEIHVIDLRYYKASIQEYLTEHHIDRVAVLYSVDTFSTDNNLFLLTR